MKNIFLLGIALCVMSILSCAGLKEVMGTEFQVTTRVHPSAEQQNTPSSYSLVPSIVTLDSLVEKEIFELISRSLAEKGWRLDQKGSGEFLVSVRFGMGSKEIRRSTTIGTYSSTTKVHENTRAPYSRTLYTCVIDILLAHRSDPESTIWSANCTSTSSTQDILTPAKSMVPYAMQKLLREGLWRETMTPW